MQEITLTDVPTTPPPATFPHRKVLTILSIPAAAALIFVAFNLFQNFLGPDGSLQVTTIPSGASVSLAGKSVGQTDYSANLRPGTYKLEVAVATSSAQIWKGSVEVRSGALTLVQRDLGPSNDFSAGVVLSLSPGSGVSVTTTPAGAEVFLDGTDIGPSPLTRPAPSPGTHKVKVQYSGYLTKEVEINVTNSWKLEVAVDLYKNPDFGVKFLQESALANANLADPVITSRADSGLDNLGSAASSSATTPWVKAEFYDLGTEDASLAKDSIGWLKGLYYHVTSHLLIDFPFHYLIDGDGVIYEGRGGGKDQTSIDVRAGLAASAIKPELRPGVVLVGYLGKTGGPTDAAKTSFAKLISYLAKTGTPAVTATRVKILDTGVGYLRVRSGPGKSYAEIAKVKTGEIYDQLEISGDWTKIKVSDTISGWVSSQYVSKI